MKGDFTKDNEVLKELQFLSGGGEMGKLIRTKDWSTSLVGTPDTWPQSLRTTLSIILNSKFPMFLFWGPELVCFYNDAYRPSLGNEGKHPNILGSRGEDYWQEIWPVIKPLIDRVLSGGEATWSEDQLIPIYRNGKMEDVYWTFSYSPVNDESGKPAGVFVTCNETTDKVLNREKLEETINQLEFAIEAANLGTWDYNPVTGKFTANNRLKDWFGLSHESEIELQHAVNVISEKDRAKVINAIQKALDYTSGGSYEVEYSIIQPHIGKETIVQAKGRAWFNDKKVAYRFNGTMEDVTEQVMARKNLEESEKKLNIVIDASELGTWELNLKTKAVAYSDRYLEIMGYKKGAVLTHEELLKRLHPDDLAIREKAFREAFENGALYYESRLIWGDGSIHWMEGRGKVFYDEEGKPSTMIGTIRDITDRQSKEEGMARMVAIVESSSDAIISKDLNGIIASWNAGAEQIFGYTEAEMIGQPLTKLIPADRINEESTILMRLRNGERVDHFETKRITKDNRILDISLNISPIRGAQGNIIGASKIARNITPQKEAERLIVANEQKFRVLADSMPQFVWTGDAGGNLNYFNQAVYAYSGFTTEEIAKEGWLQIVHPDDREENIKVWLEAVSTGKDFLFEHRFRRHDGEYRWQLSRAVPQRDEAGIIQMWIGTSTDIQDLKEEGQQKDYFISMASHELKTPVTSIKGYVQILQTMYMESEDSFLKNSLKVMDRQIATLIKLISELLDISRIKMGGLDFNKEHFEIGGLVNEIAGEIKHINPGYDIPVFIDGNAMVYADRHRIGQVLINFLTNAVKYAPDSKTIKIKSVVENDHVIVAVEDSGIGISKEDQARIFERFYRAEGKNEKTFPGFGIGLFIASEIIQRHNGNIYVTSEPGKGSIFSFALPLN